MMDVWNVSSGRSGASRFVVPEVLSGRYQAGASMEIAYKDANLCLNEAQPEGVPMWLAANIAHFLLQLQTNGVITTHMWCNRKLKFDVFVGHLLHGEPKATETRIAAAAEGRPL